jgi:predicted ester cyclase
MSQHSGRSPSGLPAQVARFQPLFESVPDLSMRIEDRVISGAKVFARTIYSATHTQTIRGVPPTGKAFTFQTIDIWLVQDGKFAEHGGLDRRGGGLQKLRA